MKQTLLAILAMMLATTFAYQNQVKYVDTALQLMEGEMAEMGGATAVEAMEVIRARAFDEAHLSNSNPDISEYAYESDSEHFQTGRACRPFHPSGEACDAIEHFHKMQTATVPFVISQDTFHFSVDVEVEYVDENGDRYNGRTTRKKVRVTVQDAWPNGGIEPFLRHPITIRRIFSP